MRLREGLDLGGCSRGCGRGREVVLSLQRQTPEDTYEDRRKEALDTLAAKNDEEPVSSVEAWALASSLTHEDATVRDWWPRLVDRPAEQVRYISRALRAAKPEVRQMMITNFGKSVKAIPREKGDGRG
jgi:hypothetical protein